MTSADELTPLAPVRLAAKGVRHQFRAAAVVWQREMIRFGRDRSRIVSAMVQPILFLFVMGTGLASGEVG
jgi:ABC-2 type transport system permease protein